MRHLRRTAFVAVQVSSLLFIEEIALAEVRCLATLAPYASAV